MLFFQICNLGLNLLYPATQGNGFAWHVALEKTNFSEEDINEEDYLLHAAIEMDKGIEAFGLGAYDLDKQNK